MPLDLLLRSNLVQQELSRMTINSLPLLDKTVQVTPQVMRMLGGLLEREVTREYTEWAAVMASLTVSENVKIMPSRRQHKGTSVLNTPSRFNKYFIQTERTGERYTKENRNL